MRSIGSGFGDNESEYLSMRLRESHRCAKKIIVFSRLPATTLFVAVKRQCFRWTGAGAEEVEIVDYH